MNKLREELQKILSGTKTSRPAVIRRSKREEYLYVTDLPQIAGEDSVSNFLKKAEKAGWTAKTENGWIYLDCELKILPVNGFQGPFGTEARCCASLLGRHMDASKRNGNRERRILIKAGEEGPKAYERACTVLHREMASMLRNRVPLPDLEIFEIIKEEREC